MSKANDQIEENVGGVQGSEPDSAEGQDVEGLSQGGVDAEAPDAGEIEWAGGLIKQAPEPR